ncbi:MAG: O-antigen ligase family protein [Rhodospirillales bacterium]|nr:O-antigen ligase family protein [Rhodospirillales bacterium]MCB9996368.1 O-antigen ligase family protein [Rhodospirillales bacterium]
MKDILQTVKWPWIVSVPLLMGGFICSVFFVGTDSPLLAPAVLCLLGYAAIGMSSGFKDGWAIPRTWVVIFVMLFWLWLVLSMFWSTTPYVSTIFTIILSILPGFFMVNIMAKDAPDWTKIHVGALWVTLGAFAVWALIQFFILYETYGASRIHHPMLNPNNLAGLFNLGIFPALALFFLAKEKRWLIVSGIVVALFYMALIVTQSRGGFLACAIATFIFVPFASLRVKGAFPWKRILFLAAVAVLLPYLANIYRGGALEENLVGETLKNVRSAEDRFYLWQSTLQMIKEHPLLGTGLASFFFYYPQYRNPLDRSDGFFAHMDPLQFWAEMGIWAPIFFYGVLIAALFRTYKAVKAAGDDQRMRLEIMAPFCGMLALTGHTHITFHLYMPGMLLPLSGLLSYWYIATERALGDRADRLVWAPAGKLRWGAMAGLALIVLLVGGWVARASGATYIMSQVQAAAMKNDKDGALEKLKLAGKVGPNTFSRYYEYEARFRVNHLWQNAKQMDKDAVRKLYEETMYYLDEAQKRNQPYTAIWDLRARAYSAVNGILLSDGNEMAKAELAKVLTANPLATDSRVGLANIYVSEGDLKKAIEVLEAGSQLPRQKGRLDLTYLVTIANLKKQVGDLRAYEMYMKEAQSRARMYGMTIQ